MLTGSRPPLSMPLAGRGARARPNDLPGVKMRSRAAIQVGVDQPLIVDELEVPDPQPHQATVKLLSSGVCHSQIHQMHNAEQDRPMVFGHEGVGIVTAVGSDVTHLREGDHAIVTWVPRTPIRGRPTPVPCGATYREELVHGLVYTWAEDAPRQGRLRRTHLQGPSHGRHQHRGVCRPHRRGRGAQYRARPARRLGGRVRRRGRRPVGHPDGGDPRGAPDHSGRHQGRQAGLRQGSSARPTRSTPPRPTPWRRWPRSAEAVSTTPSTP